MACRSYSHLLHEWVVTAQVEISGFIFIMADASGDMFASCQHEFAPEIEDYAARPDGGGK